jgi:hypothetical protein
MPTELQLEKRHGQAHRRLHAATGPADVIAHEVIPQVLEGLEKYRWMLEAQTRRRDLIPSPTLRKEKQWRSRQSRPIARVAPRIFTSPSLTSNAAGRAPAVARRFHPTGLRSCSHTLAEQSDTATRRTRRAHTIRRRLARARPRHGRRGTTPNRRPQGVAVDDRPPSKADIRRAFDHLGFVAGGCRALGRTSGVSRSDRPRAREGGAC